MIKKGLIIFTLIMLSIGSRQVSAEEWTGADKDKHFGISILLGLTTAQFPETSPLVALTLAVAPGIAKEYLFDDKPSYKDLAADAIGALLGVYIGWNLFYDKDINGVKYQFKF